MNLEDKLAEIVGDGIVTAEMVAPIFTAVMDDNNKDWGFMAPELFSPFWQAVYLIAAGNLQVCAGRESAVG